MMPRIMWVAPISVVVFCAALAAIGSLIGSTYHNFSECVDVARRQNDAMANSNEAMKKATATMKFQDEVIAKQKEQLEQMRQLFIQLNQKKI